MNGKVAAGAAARTTRGGPNAYGRASAAARAAAASAASAKVVKAVFLLFILIFGNLGKLRQFQNSKTNLLIGVSLVSGAYV